MSNFFDKYDNKHTRTRSSLTSFFAQRKDQRKKDRREFEPDTMSSFQKTPASHQRVNTYSALSFDRIDFEICLEILRTGMLTLPFEILT